MAWDDAYFEKGFDEGYDMHRDGKPRPHYEPRNPHRHLDPYLHGILHGWDAAELDANPPPPKTSFWQRLLRRLTFRPQTGLAVSGKYKFVPPYRAEGDTVVDRNNNTVCTVEDDVFCIDHIVEVENPEQIAEQIAKGLNLSETECDN